MQEKIICFLKNLEIVILQVLVNDMSNTSIAEAFYLSLVFILIIPLLKGHTQAKMTFNIRYLPHFRCYTRVMLP